MAARAATTAVYQAWNPAARSAAMATGAAATAAGNDATAPTGWSGNSMDININTLHVTSKSTTGPCPSHDSSYAETTANHPATHSRHQHGAEAGLLSNDATSEATILG